MNRFHVGLDIGQSQDPTAIAIVERAEGKGEWDAAQFAWRKTVRLEVRYLERVALGTRYPEVVERVVQVMQSRELRGRCELTVDATGVGRPVVDLLRTAGLGCPMRAVNITGGLQETTGGEYIGVPKRNLIVGLQVLLQRGALKIAAGMTYGPDLVRELMAMQVKVTPSGYEQYAAWREGTHDDLVLAVSLACWSAQKAFPKDGGEMWWTNVHQADAAALSRSLSR